ncbi:AMP-binding protein [Nitratireductor sp. XY-223]|uniref:AMP-binding protein n=1 Tax=Nitratireductor sp. XY-223 TaxID=2561926 RepID=UPI0010AADFFF|nr:AMP-binding protein [Nitratireductor sp. XY-223]
MTAAEFDGSIRDLVDRRADGAPDHIFLIDPDSGETTTFAELADRCRFVAGQAGAQGVKPGEAVGYAMVNGTDTATVILGLLYGGYLATAINLVAGRQTIDYVLADSGAKLVFCHEHTRDLLGDSPPCRTLVVAGEMAGTGRQPSATRPAASDPGLLMYTSGTTGTPKGVLLTHQNLIAGGTNTAIAHELTPQDRGLCVLPLYHINGLCVTLIGALVSGSGLILPQRFSVGKFWDQLRRHRGTWFSVVPTQISYLLNEAAANGHDPKDLDQLRFGRSASAPLSPDVQRTFEAQFNVPVIETMGLTETAAQILSNPMHGTRKIGSPGIAFGNEVIIADAEHKELPRGEEGEVLVRGRNIMLGYLNNPDATRAALAPGGWLRTGDLGRMDPQGYVTITGRLKELIIKGGENIAPREVDEALYSHPDVIEAAAFGRSCDQYGQRVEAAVRLRDGTTVQPADLINLCRDKLGAFKAPDRLHVLPELPKGPSGKIQRARLSDLTE